MRKPVVPENAVELLKRVAGGDELAFKGLYDMYSPQVYANAMRILRDHMLAEEITQETMFKVWHLGEKLNEVKNFNAYIKKICCNYCYNVLRRIQLERRTKDELLYDWDESDQEGDDAIQWQEAQKLLEDAVKTLPDYHRRVYELCYQEGLKYEEVAQKLQLSTHSVRTYMKHALRTIRAYIIKHSGTIILLVIFGLW